MKVIINTNNGESYNPDTDIIFRVYINQGFKPGHSDPSQDKYYWEVMSKHEFPHKCELMGRYSSEHPQACQDLLEKLLDYYINIDCIIELSNECENKDWFGTDCIYKDKEWFDAAFENAIKGFRKYSGQPLVGNIQEK